MHALLFGHAPSDLAQILKGTTGFHQTDLLHGSEFPIDACAEPIEKYWHSERDQVYRLWRELVSLLLGGIHGSALLIGCAPKPQPRKHEHNFVEVRFTESCEIPCCPSRITDGWFSMEITYIQ